MTQVNFPSAAAMPSAPDESSRAAALRRYAILDTEAERAFDDLTALASQLCAAPAAIITFIDGDRLWFKSTYGLTAREAPVEHSFCAHAAGEPGEVFVVGDALSDGRFLENVFVMPADGLRAYAGANIVEPGGTALGSICVVDFERREFTDDQRRALERLSRQVVDQLELRLRVSELERERERLARLNEHFENVTYALSHDLRAPLVRQGALLEAIEEDFGGGAPARGPTTPRDRPHGHLRGARDDAGAVPVPPRRPRRLRAGRADPPRGRIRGGAAGSRRGRGGRRPLRRR